MKIFNMIAIETTLLVSQLMKYIETEKKIFIVVLLFEKTF